MRKLFKKRKLFKGGNYMRKYGKLFTVLGRKFKFSAQDSDLEYLCWQCKNSPVSSDLKPSLKGNAYKYFRKHLWIDPFSKAHKSTYFFYKSSLILGIVVNNGRIIIM